MNHLSSSGVNEYNLEVPPIAEYTALSLFAY